MLRVPYLLHGFHLDQDLKRDLQNCCAEANNWPICYCINLNDYFSDTFICMNDFSYLFIFIFLDSYIWGMCVCLFLDSYIWGMCVYYIYITFTIFKTHTKLDPDWSISMLCFYVLVCRSWFVGWHKSYKVNYV